MNRPQRDSFLTRSLTPSDLELVTGLTLDAMARRQGVRLTIQDGDIQYRMTCAEPAPIAAVRRSA